MTNTVSIAAARSAKAIVNEKTKCVYVIAGAEMHFPLANANSVYLPEDNMKLFDSVAEAQAFAAALRGEVVADPVAQDGAAAPLIAATPVAAATPVKVRKPRKPKAEAVAA